MISFERDFTMTIDGRPIAAGETIDVINPADRVVFATVPDCSRVQLDAAVAAAGTAFPGWAATPIAVRRDALRAIAAALRENAEPLARLMTREQGKPLRESTADILGSAWWCEATATLELLDHVVEDSDLRRAITRRVPLGVVAAIPPWNFPVKLAMFKVAPALLAGNTVVLKPSPLTPLTTLKIGELVRDALPPGVLNVVSGGDRLGPWLTSHPDVAKVSFTGSTATGRKVMESAAATLKRVTLELGGNDAAIVLPDVDVETVAEKLFWTAFRNCGQVCIAAKRMYIHADIYEQLKTAIAAYARTVRIGDGLLADSQLGPLQNKAQYDRVLALIEEASASGLTFLTGREQPPSEGYFIRPVILDNPPEESPIVQEEQFGPVLPLLRYDTIDEAVERANASDYGLGATIWASDVQAALAIAPRLQVGTVWINEPHYLTPLGAFGGHKQSGIGVEGALDGLLEYTNAQTTFAPALKAVGGRLPGQSIP